MSAAESYAHWYNLDWKVRGIILGMEQMGAIFDDINPPFILFSIPESSCLYNDDEALKRGYQGCVGLTGLRMKVKYVRS